MTTEGAEALSEAGIRETDFHFGFALEMRYLGQQSEVRITLDHDPRKTHDSAAITDLFEAEYLRQYGLKLDGMKIETVNWLVTASGIQPDRSARKSAAETPAKPGKSRPVHMRGVAQDVPVWARDAITANDKIQGPVIIEERETTIFVLDGWTVTYHESGSLVAEKSGEK